MLTEETAIVEVVRMNSRLQNPTVDDKTENVGKLNFGQKEVNGASLLVQRPLQSAIEVKFGLNFQI